MRSGRSHDVQKPHAVLCVPQAREREGAVPGAAGVLQLFVQHRETVGRGRREENDFYMARVCPAPSGLRVLPWGVSDIAGPSRRSCPPSRPTAQRSGELRARIPESCRAGELPDGEEHISSSDVFVFFHLVHADSFFLREPEKPRSQQSLG